MPPLRPNARPALSPARSLAILLVGALALTGAPESVHALSDLAGGMTWISSGQVSNSARNSASRTVSSSSSSSALKLQPAERDGSADASYQIGFVPNRGQFAAPMRYRLILGDRSYFILDDGIIEQLPVEGSADATARGSTSDRDSFLGDLIQAAPELLAALPDAGLSSLPTSAGGNALRRLSFAPAASTRLLPNDALPGSLNFFIGADRRRWASSLPHYAQLRWRGLAPDRDLVLRIERGCLSLALVATDGAVEASSVGTEADDLPAGLESQTDPRLIYSSYLGGGRDEHARGLAVDAEGFAYIAGASGSTDLPVLGALQPGIGNSGSLEDGFVAKIAPDGRSLVYATYFGGNRQDEAFDVAVDSQGRAHLTGYTMSPDFPMEKAFQPRVNLSDGIFSGDAFVAKLSPEGDALEFSTPMGGTSRDLGKAIAVDAEGFIYVTGWTGSNFPGVNALYPLNRGVVDAFVIKIKPSGDDVVYSTHLGGSAEDLARDIAVDTEGRAYIVGTTQSVNFRVNEPFQRANAGGRDAFVARFSADGQAVDWATYLGGRGDDHGIGIALGPEGSVTVVGQTDAANFPRVDAFQNSRSGPSDLFVARLSGTGDALVWSSYLGGNSDEGLCAAEDAPRVAATPTPVPGQPRPLEGSKFPDGPVAALAVDAGGRAYVATCSASSNAPLVDPIQSGRSGRMTAYLAVLEADGQSLGFGTYLGGSGIDLPRALAVGGDGSIFMAGQTSSTDFPLAPADPFQASRRGTSDAFVLKIGPALPLPTPTAPPPSPTFEPSPTARATELPSQTPVPSAAPTTATPKTATPPSATPSPAEPSPTAVPSADPTKAPEILRLWLPWACRSCSSADLP